MIRLNWLSVKCFVNPCLFFCRCGWCNLLLWNLEFSSKIAPSILQQVNNIGPRVPQERPKSVQGCTHRGSHQKKRAGPQTITSMIPKWNPKSERLEYLGWYFSMLFRIIYCLSLNCFYDHFGINCSIIFMICLYSFEDSFEISGFV